MKPRNLTSMYNYAGQPYGVMINNQTDQPQRVSLFGGHRVLHDEHWNENGERVFRDDGEDYLIISSAVPGVTYRDLIYHTLTRPIVVDKMRVTCDSFEKNVAISAVRGGTLRVKTINAQGTILEIPVVMDIHPNVKERQVSDIARQILIDFFSTLVFTVKERTKVIIRFTPVQVVQAEKIKWHKKIIRRIKKIFSKNETDNGVLSDIPYIVCAENMTDDVQVAELFAIDGDDEIFVFDDQGNMQRNGIYYSCGTENVSYKEVLDQVIKYPFNVGRIVLYAEDETVNMYEEEPNIFAVREKNDNCDEFRVWKIAEEETPVVLKNVWEMKGIFNLNRGTSIKFNVPPNTKLTLRLYAITFKIKK